MRAGRDRRIRGARVLRNPQCTPERRKLSGERQWKEEKLALVSQKVPYNAEELAKERRGGLYSLEEALQELSGSD